MKTILLGLLFSSLAFGASLHFKARATPGININATCDIVTAVLNPKKDRLIATVQLNSCDTGNNMRNGHMAQDLEISKFPVAKLEAPLSNKPTFSARLTLHGVTKEVSGAKDGNILSFDIKMSDYGVHRRTFMGAGVQDEVHIEGTF